MTGQTQNYFNVDPGNTKILKNVKVRYEKSQYDAYFLIFCV